MEYDMTDGQSIRLPAGDYVSPGLKIVYPDDAFPNMIIGDVTVPRWPYLRRWVGHNWYTDRRTPDCGFINRDEASILYNSALLFAGRPCLEIGCWRGWSSVHLALGGVALDIIDPLLDTPECRDSVIASCEAAGVIDRVRLHVGYSPDGIDALAQSTGVRWPLIFIDGDHEGDGPSRDSEVAMRYAADTAMVLFHDLAAPDVARGIDAMRNAGWRTRIFQTTQIMGVAWRGSIEPVQHIPDPDVFWTLPRHLAGYEVSGWARPQLASDGTRIPGMDIEALHRTAMMRAQAAEDDRNQALQALRAATIQQHSQYHRAETAEAARADLVRQVATLTQERDALRLRAEAADEERLAQSLLQRDTMISLLEPLQAEVRCIGSDHTTMLHLMHRLVSGRLDSVERISAITPLIDWLLHKRILITLLRRRPQARLDFVLSEARNRGVYNLVSMHFVHWLCRRRTLFGLIRRASWHGKSIVLSIFNLLGHHYPDPSDQTLLVRPYHEPVGVIALVDIFKGSICPPSERCGTSSIQSSDQDFCNYYLQFGLETATARMLVDLLSDNIDEGLADKSINVLAHAVAGNAHFQLMLTKLLQCDLFDPNYYRQQNTLKGSDAQLAAHYLLIGDPRGLSPSPTFDPAYYRRRNPDILHNGINGLLHYCDHGRNEGRHPLPPVVPVSHQPGLLDPTRDNIIITVHEASRTGAPILGWNIAYNLSQYYNIFTIILGEGPLTPEFVALSAEVHGPVPTRARYNFVDIEESLAELFAARSYRYVIINSVESRWIARACNKYAVPSIMLVHEFSSYVKPLASLLESYRYVNEIVFPAPIVAQAAINVCPELKERQLHILPQGKSIVPQSDQTAKPLNSIRAAGLAAARAKGALIVLGAGSVELRKGVDLFIAIAARTNSSKMAHPIHFAWIGGGYRPDDDMAYSIYLKEQVERSGLGDRFTFIEEVSDLTPIYALTDVLLLTSRLDPLPNVSIDAAHLGIPIICFRNASGTADLLDKDPQTADCVVGHLDITAASDRILEWAGDRPALRRIALAIKSLARRDFDMDRYVAELDRIGSDAAERFATERDDGRVVKSQASSFSTQSSI